MKSLVWPTGQGITLEKLSISTEFVTLNPKYFRNSVKKRYFWTSGWNVICSEDGLQEEGRTCISQDDVSAQTKRRSEL